MSDFKLSEKAEARIAELKRRYPNPQSALMPVLFIVQEEKGYVSTEGFSWIAEVFNVPVVRVQELVSFYTMYRQKPAGKYHIQVCRTLSCALNGAADLVECLQRRMQLKPHEISADGLWSYEVVECLGSCGSGPAAQINDTLFEKLNCNKLNQLIDRIEREQPDLSLSTVADRLGEGLPKEPRSQIWRSSNEA